MDMPEVKAFNAELSGLYENKPPISKAKMSAITKGAIKAIKFYKHVVHSVEKFIQKCKAEYKVPGLYVIDSIVRQSRHQFGQDKDVFAPRFAKNMQQTFANLFRCPAEDKRNIIRVLNLWQKNNVFGPDVIQPLMDMADPNHPLHQEILQQQNNTANGSSLNMSHNTTSLGEGKSPPAHSPRAASPAHDQDHAPPALKFNRKLLNDFEYESEDEAAGAEPHPAHPPHAAHAAAHPAHPATHPAAHSVTHGANHNPADALGSILTNPEIMRQLQSLQAQMQMMTALQPAAAGAHEAAARIDGKEDAANESDIEFVETGPQVIEIPDAADSRSPSPRARRHRSRSKSPRRRRRSRSRSRSPRRRRDRDRDRDRERDRERDKSHKEREAEKEKQREREKKGLPPIKKENLSVCSTTLWVGHLSKLATPEELSDLFGGVGGVSAIDVVAPRGCAFVVMERRRDAAKALATLNRHKLHSKEITVAWAAGKGVKGREWKDYWEADLGVAYLPWDALHQRWLLGALSLDALEDGGAVDEDTLPPWLPPRIIPKAMMDGMPLLGALAPAGPLGARAALPALPPAPLPAALPVVPRMPPPGMTAGMPPGFAPALPPGMRPPGLPAGVPAGVQGIPRDGPLIGFPPTLPQPGMVGGFLGGLVGAHVGGLVLPLHAHAPPPRQPPTAPDAAPPVAPAAPAAPPDATSDPPDDAMELDPEEPAAEPALLPDQIQALMSKPPPNFPTSEPPPRPPPDLAFDAFDASQPPPDERRDRDKERRDRDRDRRDRRDRDRDRRDRDRAPRDRDRERDERRDRDRERGRDARDTREGREARDRPERRDRERERDRAGAGLRDLARDRSREKSPRAGGGGGGGGCGADTEKSLQERLWEMANGGPERRDPRDGPLPPHPPHELPAGDGEGAAGGSAVGEAGGAWPARMPPPYRPGPWMEVQGPPFGPRFNGMGPSLYNRPPFERPSFDGGPIFEGPPRFERPPFARMPFDMTRPRLPYDGARPPFDGPRPPFDGSRPPFDVPRPPFDGHRPSFDGPRSHFDGLRPSFEGPRPPFDGPSRKFDGDRPFDGPRFDAPAEYFDRSGRFEDREQFNERGWNGDRERDRDWDRRNDWDDRRKERRSREREERFRDRSDRRRAIEEKPRQSRDERSLRRDKDRKSRWGAAEDVVSSEGHERGDAAPAAEVQADAQTGDHNKPASPAAAPESRHGNSGPAQEDNGEDNTEKVEAVSDAAPVTLYDATDAIDTGLVLSLPAEVTLDASTASDASAAPVALDVLDASAAVVTPVVPAVPDAPAAVSSPAAPILPAEPVTAATPAAPPPDTDSPAPEATPPSPPSPPSSLTSNTFNMFNTKVDSNTQNEIEKEAQNAEMLDGIA